MSAECEGLQNAIDAMVMELHELLDDCAQGGDQTGAVYVWAVREVLNRYKVTTEQTDGTDWAEVARESPDFWAAAADPTDGTPR